MITWPFPLSPCGWTRTSLCDCGKCWNDSEGRETCLGSQGPACQPVGVEGKAVCVGATVECGYRVVTPMPWVRKDGLCHSQVLSTGPGSYHVPEVSENVASGLSEETELTPMNQLESVSFSNKKEQTTNTTMGKTLRNSMLSGRGQAQKNACCMIPFIRNSRKHWSIETWHRVSEWNRKEWGGKRYSWVYIDRFLDQRDREKWSVLSLSQGPNQFWNEWRPLDRIPLLSALTFLVPLPELPLLSSWLPQTSDLGLQAVSLPTPLGFHCRGPWGSPRPHCPPLYVLTLFPPAETNQPPSVTLTAREESCSKRHELQTGGWSCKMLHERMSLCFSDVLSNRFISPLMFSWKFRFFFLARPYAEV